jgi:hypothetical protein
MDIASSGGVAQRKHLRRQWCPSARGSSDADSPGTAANFGSCGIGSRGGSDSDIDSSGTASTFGPFGGDSHGSSDIVTGSRGSSATDGPSHGSSDIGSRGIGSSGTATGRGGGPWCARGGGAPGR